MCHSALMQGAPGGGASSSDDEGGGAGGLFEARRRLRPGVRSCSRSLC